MNGDFIGRRYATYLNDIKVGSSFMTGLEASHLMTAWWIMKRLKISGNITNWPTSVVSPSR